MKNQPDFIVDSSGKAQDVRHEKIEREQSTSSKANNPNSFSGTQKDQTFHKKAAPSRGLIIIPIGLIITLIIAVLKMLFPSITRPTISESDYSMFKSATSSYLSGNYDIALYYVSSVISHNPDLSEGYLTRGLINDAQGEHLNAIADFNKAIELSPDLPDAYNNRGVTYTIMGEYEQAINDFDKAIQLDSNYAKAYFNRGLVYVILESYESAIADFDKSIEYSTNFGPRPTNRSTPSSLTGDINFYDYFLFYSKDVDLGSAYYYRGMAYLRNGDDDRAYSDFDKAYEYGFDAIKEFNPDIFGEN